MSSTHPRKREDGGTVKITKPHAQSDTSAWESAAVIATATPDCPMPEAINGVSVSAWQDAPDDHVGWEALVTGATFSEPLMPTVPGKKPAAGVVTVEPDGRVWVVAPTNTFGGYTHTFPKGKLDGLSPHASAIKEAFEESGLRVELTSYLCDSTRSTSVTRYYTARRLGGNPADMGWESQAVLLVPADKLAEAVTHVNDASILAALAARSIVAYDHGLASGHRILSTLAGYRSRFGEWPTRLAVDGLMHDALRDEILTTRGWQLLNERLKVIRLEEPALYAEGVNQQRHDYDAEGSSELQAKASVWLWGVNLAV